MYKCLTVSDEWFETAQWSKLYFVVADESETLIRMRTNSLE